MKRHDSRPADPQPRNERSTEPHRSRYQRIKWDRRGNRTAPGPRRIHRRAGRPPRRPPHRRRREIADNAGTAVGFPVGNRLYGYDGHANRIYVRADVERVEAVSRALARTANPANPVAVAVSRPSDVLTARLAVARSGTGLFLGFGAVALLVGAIGIANVMVIGVLERRAEIGLRRALGARRVHIGAQFLTESLLLALLGGATGLAAGAAITAVVAYDRGWTATGPALALWGGMAAALGIGAVAGLYPAVRAARLAPTEALRTI